MDTNQNSGGSENKGCLTSLAHGIGWLYIGSWLLMAAIFIISCIYFAVSEPKDFVGYIKTHFGQLQYAAPITTGIFLTIFTVGILQPRKKERPALDFFAMLAVAAILTCFIIYIISLVLSGNLSR